MQPRKQVWWPVHNQEVENENGVQMHEEREDVLIWRSGLRNRVCILARRLRLSWPVATAEQVPGGSDDEYGGDEKGVDGWTDEWHGGGAGERVSVADTSSRLALSP